MDDLIRQDSLITIAGESYYIITTDNSTGKNYGFASQIDKNGNATGAFKIIYKDENNIKILDDPVEMVGLYKIFRMKVAQQMIGKSRMEKSQGSKTIPTKIEGQDDKTPTFKSIASEALKGKLDRNSPLYWTYCDFEDEEFVAFCKYLRDNYDIDTIKNITENLHLDSVRYWIKASDSNKPKFEIIYNPEFTLHSLDDDIKRSGGIKIHDKKFNLKDRTGTDFEVVIVDPWHDYKEKLINGKRSDQETDKEPGKTL